MHFRSSFGLFGVHLQAPAPEKKIRSGTCEQVTADDLPDLRGVGSGVRVSKIGKFCKIFAIFANFWRARSRLYQNEILQENMRSTGFFKLYKIKSFAFFCTAAISKFSQKIGLKKQQFS